MAILADDCPARQQLLADAGAIRALPEAWRSAAARPDVQATCASALVELVYGSLEHCRTAAAEGGIPALVDLISQDGSDYVEEMAATALARLAMDSPQHCRAILAADPDGSVRKTLEALQERAGPPPCRSIVPRQGAASCLRAAQVPPGLPG